MNEKYLQEAKECEKRWKESGMLDEMLKKTPPGGVLLEGQRLTNNLPKAMHLNDMNNPESIWWLLTTIKTRVEDHTKWGKPLRVTKKDIFRGSYDVWESKDDGPKYNQIMNDRLIETRDLGLIVNELGDDWRGNWTLTELGEEYLRNHPSHE